MILIFGHILYSPTILIDPTAHLSNPSPMRTLLSPLRLAAILTAMVFASAHPAVAKVDTVVIDAGHGGFNIGQKNGKVYEKWLALDVALRLDRYLKSKGVKTVMTRRGDNFLSLSERVRLGNRYAKRSVFVSVHFNGARNRSATGLETFYYSKRSYALASAIQKQIVPAVRGKNRGVKHARFHVIRNSKQPAVLVECGFLTNEAEMRRCKTGTYRQAMAEAIGRGIIAHLKAIN